MLFVLALVAAVGYMFLNKQTIEANITDQVNEYLAQQQTCTHTGVQDSSDAEIKRRLKRERARSVDRRTSTRAQQQLKTAEREFSSKCRARNATTTVKRPPAPTARRFPPNFISRSRKLSRLKSIFEHMESLWYKVHCQLKKHVLPCMQFRTGLQSGLAREDVLTAMA